MAEATQEHAGARSAEPRPTWRSGLGGEMSAEFLGMFIIILLGCGSVALSLVGLPGSGRQEPGTFGPANWLIIAWGWGLAVTFAVFAAGGVSGAHLNPAVTLAFAVRRGFPWRKVGPFWLAQVLGGLAGAAVVYATYTSAISWFDAKNSGGHRSMDTFSIFATFPAEYFHGNMWGPIVDQVVGTAILVAVVCALVDKRNNGPLSNLAPLFIGLVVVAIGMTYGVNAGYAINPARDLGPRLFTLFEGWGHFAFPGDGKWFSGYFWVPIVGPLVGGVVGACVYDLFIGQFLKARTGRGPDDPEAVPEPGPGEASA
jgi:glycerol uptake facilitator protein